MDSKIIAGVVVLIVVIALAAVLMMGGGQEEQTPAPQEAKETQAAQQETQTQAQGQAGGKVQIRWATSKSTSSGYKAMVTLAKVVNDALPDVEIVPIATAGAVAGMKGFAKGEYDAAYAADISLKEMYGKYGRFEGFEPQRMLLQTLWVYTIDIGIAVPKDKAGEYKCWRDFDGKKLFTLPKAWDVGTALRKGLDALGVKYEHVELDLDAVATALQKGDIVATGIYVTGGGRSLAGWEKQLEVQADLAVVNPCPDEIEEMRSKGVPIATVPVTAFSKDVGVKEFTGVRIYYGFHTGTNLDEDTVYRLLKTIYANIDKLAELDPAFSQVQKDFLGFQKEAIEVSKEIPLHPGYAKFLKENGVWSDEWKVGG